MTCNACNTSILGRDIIGRSIPGQNVRYKNGITQRPPSPPMSRAAPAPKKAEINNGLIFVGLTIGAVVIANYFASKR